MTDTPPELDRQGLSRWYGQNWRQLRFDPSQRKWVIPGARPMRTWTDVEGRTIVAELISAGEDSVTIMRSDGRVFLLPLERLSEADRDHVKEETSHSSTP